MAEVIIISLVQRCCTSYKDDPIENRRTTYTSGSSMIKSMIKEDIENIRKNGFDVEEIPTGYIFTQHGGQSDGKQGNILIHKEACEIIQKIGKIEEIQVVDGDRIRIVILRAIIGSG
jgi:hypothetical protein